MPVFGDPHIPEESAHGGGAASRPEPLLGRQVVLAGLHGNRAGLNSMIGAVVSLQNSGRVADILVRLSEDDERLVAGKDRYIVVPGVPFEHMIPVQQAEETLTFAVPPTPLDLPLELPTEVSPKTPSETLLATPCSDRGTRNGASLPDVERDKAKPSVFLYEDGELLQVIDPLEFVKSGGKGLPQFNKPRSTAPTAPAPPAVPDAPAVPAVRVAPTAPAVHRTRRVLLPPPSGPAPAPPTEPKESACGTREVEIAAESARGQAERCELSKLAGKWHGWSSINGVRRRDKQPSQTGVTKAGVMISEFSSPSQEDVDDDAISTTCSLSTEPRLVQDGECRNTELQVQCTSPSSPLSFSPSSASAPVEMVKLPSSTSPVCAKAKLRPPREKAKPRVACSTTKPASHPRKTAPAMPSRDAHGRYTRLPSVRGSLWKSLRFWQVILVMPALVFALICSVCDNQAVRLAFESFFHRLFATSPRQEAPLQTDSAVEVEDAPEFVGTFPKPRMAMITRGSSQGSVSPRLCGNSGSLRVGPTTIREVWSWASTFTESFFAWGTPAEDCHEPEFCSSSDTVSRCMQRLSIHVGLAEAASREARQTAALLRPGGRWYGRLRQHVPEILALRVAMADPAKRLAVRRAFVDSSCNREVPDMGGVDGGGPATNETEVLRLRQSLRFDYYVPGGFICNFFGLANLAMTHAITAVLIRNASNVFVLLLEDEPWCTPNETAISSRIFGELGVQGRNSSVEVIRLVAGDGVAVHGTSALLVRGSADFLTKWVLISQNYTRSTLSELGQIGRSAFAMPNDQMALLRAFATRAPTAGVCGMPPEESALEDGQAPTEAQVTPCPIRICDPPRG